MGRALLTQGLMLTKTVRKTERVTTAAREEFFHLYAEGRPPLVFRSGALDYRSFGGTLQPSVQANFTQSDRARCAGPSPGAATTSGWRTPSPAPASSGPGCRQPPGHRRSPCSPACCCLHFSEKLRPRPSPAGPWARGRGATARRWRSVGVAVDDRPPGRGADQRPGGDVREEVGLVVDAGEADQRRRAVGDPLDPARVVVGRDHRGHGEGLGGVPRREGGRAAEQLEVEGPARVSAGGCGRWRISIAGVTMPPAISARDQAVLPHRPRPRRRRRTRPTEVEGAEDAEGAGVRPAARRSWAIWFAKWLWSRRSASRTVRSRSGRRADPRRRRARSAPTAAPSRRAAPPARPATSISTRRGKLGGGACDGRRAVRRGLGRRGRRASRAATPEAEDSGEEQEERGRRAAARRAWPKLMKPPSPREADDGSAESDEARKSFHAIADHGGGALAFLDLRDDTRLRPLRPVKTFPLAGASRPAIALHGRDRPSARLRPPHHSRLR